MQINFNWLQYIPLLCCDVGLVPEVLIYKLFCGVIHPKERSVQGFTDAPVGSQIWFFHLGHEDT